MNKPTPIPTGTGGQDPSSAGQGQQSQGGGNPQNPIQGNGNPLNTIVSNQEVPVMAYQPQQVIIEKSNEESILTEKPVIQNRELPNTPSAVINPASDDDGSLLVVGEELIVNPAPMAVEVNLPETQGNIATYAPVNNVIDPNITSKQSLRDIQLNRMTVNTEAPPITQQDESMLNNLFGGPTEVTESVQITPTDLGEVLTHDEVFANPVSFIEASIRDLDLMIGHIVETHTAKLEEAEGYKSEEEKFAGLKVGAYADAEKMMKEKAHAEKMKTYFLNQKDHALGLESGLPRESVETTLASLSVKNSVDGATHHDSKKETNHKKAPQGVKAE